MIEANELRLNNWVYSPEVGSNVQVTLLSNDNWLSLSSATWDQPSFEEIDPIPLSEEILLKCGFEKTFEGGSLWYLGKFFVSSLDFIYWSNIKILYLHQLQNLYWCLCGKELEINL